MNGNLNTFNTTEGYELPANNHLSEHANSIMFNFTRPAGQGPTSLPVNIRVNTFLDPGGALNQGIVYNYGWRWNGVAICRGC